MVTECQILVKGTVVVGCLGFLVAGDYSLIARDYRIFRFIWPCFLLSRTTEIPTVCCSKTNWATRSWVKQQTFSVRTTATSRVATLWRKRENKLGFPDVILFENGVSQFTIIHCTILLPLLSTYVMWYFKNVCEYYSFSNTAATTGLKSCKECSSLWPCFSAVKVVTFIYLVLDLVIGFYICHLTMNACKYMLVS